MITERQFCVITDRMSTKELRPWLKDHWPQVRSALEAGTYRPQPVRRATIPKPSGGERMLGVPAAVDRLICQALSQVLTPVFDPHFHPHSFGFRPGRSAHQAVERARQFIADGTAWCVDFDLDSFFEAIPDAPLSKVVLNMQGGKKGLIVNSRHLCVKPNRNRANANLAAHNGRILRIKPVVRAVKCGKKRKKAKRSSHRRARAASASTVR